MAAGRSSTGISPRPMLMGAPRNALRAFNAGVSLSCLRVLAHRIATPVLRPNEDRSLVMGSPKSQRLFGERRSSEMSELSRVRGSEGCAACTDEVMAHRPTGSAQTDRIRLPYAAPEASRRAFFVKEL